MATNIIDVAARRGWNISQQSHEVAGFFSTRSQLLTWPRTKSEWTFLLAVAYNLVWATEVEWIFLAFGLILTPICILLRILVTVGRVARSYHLALVERLSKGPPSRCATCRALIRYCNHGFKYGSLDAMSSEVRLLRLLPDHDSLQ